MSQFNVGDRVYCNTKCNSAYSGKTYTVELLESCLSIGEDISNPCQCQEGWILIERANNSKNIMSNLIQKARLAIKGETEKSLIKVGVLDANEQFTQEGQALFIDWLFQTNKATFKTEVVDPILAEEEKEKK